MPKRASPEHQLQMFTVGLLARCAEPGMMFFSVPNGGFRTKSGARWLKAEGVRAGVADLALVIKGQAAFLELKAKGGTLSPAQKAFAADCERCGAWWAVASSPESARDVLFKWGALRPTALIS
jgi:hypothetical protein